MRDPAQRGSILLEVVLAVALFAAAAAVIGAGLKSAIDGVERLRLSTHAVNLAVTVISELQLGSRSLEEIGPEGFGPPFDGWTWELAVSAWKNTSSEAGNLTRVEVVVRHDDPPLVHRLAQVIPIKTGRTGPGVAIPRPVERGGRR